MEFAEMKTGTTVTMRRTVPYRDREPLEKGDELNVDSLNATNSSFTGTHTTKGTYVGVYPSMVDPA